MQVKTAFNEHLRNIGACTRARLWANGKTAKEAWDTCNRPAWLLWWAAKDGASQQSIVLTIIALADAVSHSASVPQAALALEAARECINEPTDETRLAARNLAGDIAFAATEPVDADAVAEAAAYASAALDAIAAASAYTTYANDAVDAFDANIIRERLTQPWRDPQ